MHKHNADKTELDVDSNKDEDVTEEVKRREVNSLHYYSASQSFLKSTRKLLYSP